MEIPFLKPQRYISIWLSGVANVGEGDSSIGKTKTHMSWKFLRFCEAIYWTHYSHFWS